MKGQQKSTQRRAFYMLRALSIIGMLASHTVHAVPPESVRAIPAPFTAGSKPYMPRIKRLPTKEERDYATNCHEEARRAILSGKIREDESELKKAVNHLWHAAYFSKSRSYNALYNLLTMEETKNLVETAFPLAKSFNARNLLAEMRQAQSWWMSAEEYEREHPERAAAASLTSAVDEEAEEAAASAASAPLLPKRGEAYLTEGRMVLPESVELAFVPAAEEGDGFYGGCYGVHGMHRRGGGHAPRKSHEIIGF